MIVMIPPSDLSTLLEDHMVALIVYVFLYLTYYFGSDFAFIKSFRERFNETPDSLEQSIYLRRLMGFVLLGIIPFITVLLFFDEAVTFYGVGLPKGEHWVLWTFVPIILVLIASIFRSPKGIDISYYPEVRQPVWTTKRHVTNGLYWSLYLLGYEFAIRGFLFFSLLYAFGLWPAVIINCVIYSLIHIFKGQGEAYGAFFLGILLCLMTYYTSSVWPALIVHVVLAVSNDIKAVSKASI
jgi:membrane protease YdiL (CAAX protease family)